LSKERNLSQQAMNPLWEDTTNVIAGESRGVVAIEQELLAETKDEEPEKEPQPQIAPAPQSAEASKLQNL
jgi:hypothetical protein